MGKQVQSPLITVTIKVPLKIHQAVKRIALKELKTVAEIYAEGMATRTKVNLAQPTGGSL